MTLNLYFTMGWGRGGEAGEGWGLKREGEGWEGERGIIMIGKEAGVSEAGLL